VTNAVKDAVTNSRLAHPAAYVVVGLATVAVDVGTLTLLRELAHWPIWAATTAGFCASVGVNFFGNRAWAGRESTRGLLDHAVRYALLLGFNYMLTLLLLLGLTGAGLGYLAAKAVAVLLTAGISFVSYRTWVFA
jgi:putative flippase GtrA